MPAYRVVHVNTERGWRGGENQVLLLHRGLVAAGVDSLLLCRGGEELARRTAAAGLPLATVAGGPLFRWRALQALRAHAATGALLHAHASAAHGLARLAVAGSTAPLIVTRRVDFTLRRDPLGRWKYGPRVARFIAVSHAVARVMAAGGVDPARTTVIHDGVERAADDPLAARLDEPAGRLIVLCAAALAAHKGHRVLLDAWRRVEAAEVPATLLLAGGDAGCLAALRRQAAGLTHVRFLGWRDDLPRLMAAADVAVLSSLEEGLGSVLIEAQLAGLPVVATTAGGIPEVVADGISGLLVPPADATALATALRRILDDHALRARLAGGARMNGRNFLAARMVGRHQDLYAEVAASATSTAAAAR